jgi:hypothetical protein
MASWLKTAFETYINPNDSYMGCLLEAAIIICITIAVVVAEWFFFVVLAIVALTLWSIPYTLLPQSLFLVVWTCIWHAGFLHADRVALFLEPLAGMAVTSVAMVKLNFVMCFSCALIGWDYIFDVLRPHQA